MLSAMLNRFCCPLGIVTSLILAFTGLPGCTTPEEEQVLPPNIILFLVDDMGWQDTSVEFHSERTPFNDHFRTPNMERLASMGIRFTQAYAAPVCSPTRTSIMTGQSPVRHHVTNWTLFPDRDQSGETERLKAPRDWRKEGLQADDLTLPKLLQGQGYFTIIGVHTVPVAMIPPILASTSISPAMPLVHPDTIMVKRITGMKLQVSTHLRGECRGWRSIMARLRISPTP